MFCYIDMNDIDTEMDYTQQGSKLSFFPGSPIPSLKAI